MNKLMARIFAAVMVVVMLGTVSFAASYDTGVITTEKAADAEEAVETVLAFATKTANATAPAAGDVIIAIDQAADVPTTINIDADKLEGQDYIAIVFSGAAGAPEYAYINLPKNNEDVELDAITVGLGEVTDAEGNIYTNVAKAQFSFNAEAGRKVTELGFRFKQTSAGTTGLVNELKKTVDAVLDTALTFSAAIVGAPDGTTFEATPYIIYE